MLAPFTWFIPTAIFLLAATLVILATYLYLCSTHRKRYILIRTMTQKQARRARADAAMLELSNMLVRRAESIHTLAAHVLDAAREHTGCPHGFVSEVDPATGDNVAHTLATEMQDADIPEGAGRRIAFPVQEDGTYRGLFGHALNTGQAFYTNDPASHPASVGTPEWHIDITIFLTAPAVVDDQVLGQIALANSPRPFTDDDLSTMTRMANFYALAVQRKRTEDNIRASLAEKMTLAPGRDIVCRVEVQAFNLTPDMEPATMPSLGMQLVTNLSQQFHAALDIKGDGGAFFRLEFGP